MKKKLIQKLQQLVDELPLGNKKEEVKYDLLRLKISNSDYHYVLLAHKYKDNLQQITKNERK